MKPLLSIIALIHAGLVAHAMTPAEWLDAQPKPKFRAGHTLPRLTRFSWDMDDAVRVSLARDWGYALEFGVASHELQLRVFIADARVVGQRGVAHQVGGIVKESVAQARGWTASSI